MAQLGIRAFRLIGKEMSLFMSKESCVLISVGEIQRRIEEIDKERKSLYDQQYQYGYMAPMKDIVFFRQEQQHLKKVLEVLEGYSLEDIQMELDNRDPMQKANWRGSGLAKYSFEVLGHAEKVLQHQDRELQARVDLGEKVIGTWEEAFRNLTWEEDRAVYGLIRDKDLPYEWLEEKIRQCLVCLNEELQEDLCEIGGRRCIRTDSWKDGEDSFVLGNAVDAGDFWYAAVNGSAWNVFEYDFRPSREQVVDDYLNAEAMRALDEYEAEFGADGRKAQEQLVPLVVVLAEASARTEDEHKYNGEPVFEL